MANIILPKRFKDKLETNQELDGIVRSTLSSFGDILDESKLYFFSEYTDHGIKHIESVLSSSDNLITDGTYSDILSYKDIGYYILSVILHDIGMHLDLEGFKCLINGDFDDVLIREIDSISWGKLWEDYLNEAQKFSGKQLRSIFGDENTLVRVPPFSKQGEITENDKKLIGEFIRRHHPRIAHEIAIKGFPNKSKLLEFGSNLGIKNQNIIGLIARSHGIGLRKCIDYIETEYGRDNRRFPNGIHATFLMVLLRIADYIQIDSGRTSKAVIKVKAFYSPISEMEHNAHLAIDDINLRWHDDPERIFVNASPMDSKMYLKLNKLIKDIQYEFDISWAVLGELYGKGTDKDKAKIKYRRISSNLDDELFIKKQNYIADSFAFKANDEIIKLLVAPLYGDDPKYGVRELLQNAIDACKERESLEKMTGANYSPLIKIEIEKGMDGTSYFKITDNGIGMDTDVIKNYFLSAGASYRKSLDWQKDFVNEKGKSVVRRSGRFGVGILAAFLIGEEIYVETKKLHNHNGYKFDANLNYDQINVIKDSTISEGTVVKIKINSNKISEFELIDGQFQWPEWYILSNPQVKYFLYGKEIIPYLNLNPDNIENLPTEWHSIDSDGYNKILWTYSDKYANTSFACNGIIIPDVSDNELQLGLISNAPQISVFDNDAFLPLTLDRNDLSEKLSFQIELLEDIYKDFIAYMLLFDRNSYINNGKIFVNSNNLNHPGTRGNPYSSFWELFYGISQYRPTSTNLNILRAFVNTILISKEGFIINYNYFIRKLKSVKVILIQCYNLLNEDFELDIQDSFILLTENKVNAIPDYINAIEGKEYDFETETFGPINSRVFLKSEKYNFLFNSDKKRVSAWLNDRCKVQFEKFGLTCLHLHEPKPSLIDDTFLNKNAKNIHFIREYEIFCPYDGDQLLNKLLEKYIGDDVVIPFSIDERRKKYSFAFKELERYMKKYLNVKNEI